MDEPDPITQMYAALCELLKASEEINELVKPRNFIRFDDPEDATPLKQTIGNADLPEVQVWSEAAGGQLCSSSNSSRMTRQFTIVLVTGSYRVHQRLFPLEWAVYKSLVAWERNLGSLTYLGERFVANVKLLGSNAGDSDAARNRDIRGWTSLWRVEAQCEFSSEQVA